MDDENKTPSNNVTPIRNEKGHFKKGVSGNPQGGNKPRLYRDILGQKFEIEELYRNEAGRVFYELIKIISDAKTPPTARVSAIKEFNDRALGKALQSVRTVRNDDQFDTIDPTLLSDDVLAALASAKRTSQGDK